MTWINKEKIPQSGGNEEIVTPDGFQILVGANEDLILWWQVAFNNWVQKTKNAAGAWVLKTKTIS